MTTAVTLLQTLLHGRLVGKDNLNNKYYEDRNPKQQPPRRWVVYGSKPEDASLVPPAWHAWLHHTAHNPPNNPATPRLKHPWQKPHQPNATGTAKAFSPPNKKPSQKTYEAWTPSSS